MKKYYCKHCGTSFAAVHSLHLSSCTRHPDGRGRHELYEGTEKDVYTCKYCGMRSRSINALTCSTCVKHPDGAGKGRHSPAL